jgi:hypothetical protein
VARFTLSPLHFADADADADADSDCPSWSVTWSHAGEGTYGEGVGGSYGRRWEAVFPGRHARLASVGDVPDFGYGR